jgi:hypothetical protein
MKSFGVRLKVKEIRVPVWYCNGGLMIARDSLENNHPESTYNWIVRNIGVDPEDFGVKRPDCPDMKRHYVPEDY